MLTYADVASTSAAGGASLQCFTSLLVYLLYYLSSKTRTSMSAAGEASLLTLLVYLHSGHKEGQRFLLYETKTESSAS